MLTYIHVFSSSLPSFSSIVFSLHKPRGMISSLIHYHHTTTSFHLLQMGMNHHILQQFVYLVASWVLGHRVVKSLVKKALEGYAYKERISHQVNFKQTQFHLLVNYSFSNTTYSSFVQCVIYKSIAIVLLKTMAVKPPNIKYIIPCLWEKCDQSCTASHSDHHTLSMSVWVAKMPFVGCRSNHHDESSKHLKSSNHLYINDGLYSNGLASFIWPRVSRFCRNMWKYSVTLKYQCFVFTASDCAVSQQAWIYEIDAQ